MLALGTLTVRAGKLGKGFTVVVKLFDWILIPVPWNRTPAYFQGNQYVKSIPPPHPWTEPFPPPLVLGKSTQVANAPISNSLGLKYSGGGGGGATTCLGSGGPANAVIVCKAMPITAKAIIIFFITIGSSLVYCWYALVSLPALDREKDRHENSYRFLYQISIFTE